MIHDEDEFETIVESRPCTMCNGHLKDCKGGYCNGSFSMKQQRRSPAEITKIKLERKIKREDEILRQAEYIQRSRLYNGSR
jgi:hypothetical protein